MPIRYCKAKSKRTGQRCRARAVRGMQVCYHHGGKSRRGLSHPNFKHGYYSRDGYVRYLLSIAMADYRRALRSEQIAEITDDLQDTMPLETVRDFQRFMAKWRLAVYAMPMPEVKLTPELAAEVLAWRWPGWVDRE